MLINKALLSVQVQFTLCRNFYMSVMRPFYILLLLLFFISYFLQRHIFSALSQIAKHSVDLAEMVVEAEIFPAVLACLKGKKLCTIYWLITPKGAR